MRLAKGQQRTKEKEAVVTGLCTMSPHPRTPQESEPTARPEPVGQEWRATLEGKAVAMSRLAQPVAQCDWPHIQPHVGMAAILPALASSIRTAAACGRAWTLALGT